MNEHATPGTDDEAEPVIGSEAEAQADGSFAFFSLTGDRFDAVGMPAENAREIGYFRDAIWQMARTIWLERNPDRRKVPDGFEGAFNLRLTRVDEGSARPQLLLRKPRKPLADETWDDWREIFGTARDQVTAALNTVDKQHVVPAGISQNTRKALKRVGSTLRPTEAITVGHPTDTTLRAHLDESTRDVLAQIDDVLPPSPVAHQLVGFITEYDGSSLSFRLKTETGVSTCVLERFNPELADFARSVLAIDGVTAPDVSVEGETLDPSRRAVHLFNVHRVSLVRNVAEKALVLRLRELSDLRAGWWGPQSLAPAQSVLDRLELVLSGLAGLAVPVDLIPTADGSVVIEVRRDTTELSATIEPDGQMGLVRDNVETDELDEAEVAFDVNALLTFLTRGVLG